MTAKPSIQERFGLNRPNFILNPLSSEDASFFAQRTHVNVSDIIENLQIDLATGLPPKRLFWGPYGGGKTHTLQNTMLTLESLTPIHHVYVECPDLSRRSTFLDLYHEGIMRSMGQDFVLGLLEKARDKAGYARRDELLALLRDQLSDEELAKAVAILIDPTDERRLLLWTWISGVKVSATGLKDLGQTQDLSTAEPARLSQVVTIIGNLVSSLEQKTLVLILDEMDRIGAVGAETITQFSTGFRRLVEPHQQHVAVLIAASAENYRELPDIFWDRGPVGSCFSHGAVKEIPSLDDPDVEPFIQQIIKHVRNPDIDISALVEEAKNAGVGETIKEDLFPFTEEAIQALKGNLGLDMTPREITLSMTHALGKAHLLNRSAITSDVIS
jgi:hypothetical protein